MPAEGDPSLYSGGTEKCLKMDGERVCVCQSAHAAAAANSFDFLCPRVNRQLQFIGMAKVPRG